jgi:hypothetical protein
MRNSIMFILKPTLIATALLVAPIIATAAVPPHPTQFEIQSTGAVVASGDQQNGILEIVVDYQPADGTAAVMTVQFDFRDKYPQGLMIKTGAIEAMKYESDVNPTWGDILKGSSSSAPVKLSGVTFLYNDYKTGSDIRRQCKPAGIQGVTFSSDDTEVMLMINANDMKYPLATCQMTAS